MRLAVEKYLSKIDHKPTKDTIARCSFYADTLGYILLSQLNEWDTLIEYIETEAQIMAATGHKS